MPCAPSRAEVHAGNAWDCGMSSRLGHPAMPRQNAAQTAEQHAHLVPLADMIEVHSRWSCRQTAELAV